MKLLWWRKSPKRVTLNLRVNALRGLVILMLDIRSNQLSNSSDQFLRQLEINPMDLLGLKADLPMPRRSKTTYMKLSRDQKKIVQARSIKK